MCRSIWGAFVKGPSNEKVAKKMILIAVVAVAITAISVLFDVRYSYFIGRDNLGLQAFLKSFEFILVGMMTVVGYFTYRQKLWAAIISLLNEISDVLITLLLSRAPSLISLVEIIIFIGAIRAIFYLKKTETY